MKELLKDIWYWLPELGFGVLAFVLASANGRYDLPWWGWFPLVLGFWFCIETFAARRSRRIFRQEAYKRLRGDLDI